MIGMSSKRYIADVSYTKFVPLTWLMVLTG